MEACLAAAAAGARILEKHVTLDHHQSDFRDHQLSLEPEELRSLVARVAEVETLMGRPRRGVMADEEATRDAARRSVVAARELPVGHRVVFDDLTWLRPRDGVPVGDEGRLVGKRVTKAVRRGEPLLPRAFDRAD